jgi:hypothetical protein
VLLFVFFVSKLIFRLVVVAGFVFRGPPPARIGSLVVQSYTVLSAFLFHIDVSLTCSIINFPSCLIHLVKVDFLFNSWEVLMMIIIHPNFIFQSVFFFISGSSHLAAGGQKRSYDVRARYLGYQAAFLF